jgi:hypothetical protein
MYFPVILQECINCLGALIGLGAGIFLLTRRHVSAGLLAMGGFLLIGTGPVTQFLLYGPPNLISSTGLDYEAIIWMDACLRAGPILLGSILLAVALVMAIRPPADETPPSSPQM